MTYTHSEPADTSSKEARASRAAALVDKLNLHAFCGGTGLGIGLISALGFHSTIGTGTGLVMLVYGVCKAMGPRREIQTHLQNGTSP